MLLDIIIGIFFIIIGFVIFFHGDKIYSYLIKKNPPTSEFLIEFEKSHVSEIIIYMRLIGLFLVLGVIIRLIIVFFF